MSIGRFVGDIDLYSNPIEEEEAEEEYRRKLKEAAEKAKKAAEEQRKRQEEAAKKAQEAQKAPERPKAPEQPKPPKPPEKPETPKPIEQPKPPEEVNRQEARDQQRLEQQTPETQAAFESKYGARAKEEWVREHEQELDRNLGVYGKEEPRAGDRPLPGVDAPNAPDRTIGRYTYDPNAPAGEARRVQPPGQVPGVDSRVEGLPAPVTGNNPMVGQPQNPMVTATTPQAPTSFTPPTRDDWPRNPGVTQAAPAASGQPPVRPNQPPVRDDWPTNPGVTPQAIPTRDDWPTNPGVTPQAPGQPPAAGQPAAQEQQAPIPADAPPRPTDPGDYVLVQSPNGVKAWVTRDVWSNGSYTDPGTGAQRPYGEVLQVIYDPDKELRPVQMPEPAAQPGALPPVPMPQLGEPGAGERLDPGFNKPPFVTPLPAPAAGTTDPAITSATGPQAPAVPDSGMKIPGQPAQALPANAPPMPLLGDSILVGHPGQEPYWYSRSGYEDAKNAARIEGIPVPPIIYDPKAAGASSVNIPTAPTTTAPTAPAAPTTTAPTAPAAPATAPVTAPAAPVSNAIPADAPPKPPRDVLLVQTENGTKMWMDRSVYETGTMGTGGPPMKSLYQLVADPLAATLDALGPQTALMSARSTSPGGVQPSNIRLLSSQSGTPTPTAPTPAPSPYGTYVPPTSLTAPGTPAGALLSAQQNPYLGAFSTTKPVETILQITNKNPQDALHILGGISALVGGKLDAEGKAVGAWAEPYLNDVARLAWAREEVTNGRNSDPRNAPLDYIENWKDGYFGGDPNVPLVKEMNQQMIDYGVQKANQEGKPFNWKDVYGQNGEAGLIVNQTTGVDCGPNAASTVLRSLGYNVDPKQMFNYAIDNQYHTSKRLPNGTYTDGQFTGPENFAKMLTNDAGVPAKVQWIDPNDLGSSQRVWAQVDAELDAGRVVVLSSPGHYWSVSAKRQGPNGTEYYGGATSTAAKNPAWGTKGQFSYGGNPNAIITTQGTADPNSKVVKSLNLQPPTPGAAGPPNPNNRALLSAMTTRQRAEHVLGAQARRDPAHQPTQTQSQPSYPGEDQPSMAGMPPTQAPSQAPSPNMSSQSKPSRDPREAAAATENLWSPNQSNRHALMVESFNRPMADKDAEFNAAIEQGLDEEGITDPGLRAAWKKSMRMLVIGEGLPRGVPGENTNLNPYMIAGESSGKPGTADRMNSSALGYFQFLRSKADGSDYIHEQHRPAEYKANPYHPVGQVRQYIRAVSTSQKPGYRGDPMGPVNEKINRSDHTWGP